MPGERQLDLNSQQKLFLAAKVNRFCEGGPEGFRKTLPLSEIKEIIDTLDPLIIPSFNVQLDTRNKKKQSSTTGLADTGIGQINASFNEYKEKGLGLGMEEYRIGSYVVIKTEGLGFSLMTFNHYWEREIRNLETEFQNDPPINVKYLTKNRELISISHLVPIPFINFGRFHLNLTREEYWWKKESAAAGIRDKAKKLAVFSIYHS